jgi:hypothetical protein
MTRRRRVLLLRFVTGQPMNGRRCSDGTFWRRGTRTVGRPPYVVTWRWWTLAAGWQRALVRLGAVLATLVVVATTLALVTP